MTSNTLPRNASADASRDSAVLRAAFCRQSVRWVLPPPVKAVIVLDALVAGTLAIMWVTARVLLRQIARCLLTTCLARQRHVG